MPELPEVETVCRGLQKAIQGKKLVRLELRRRDMRFPFPKNLVAATSDTLIKNITRRAKYILIHLDNGQIILVHLGMSGRLVIAEAKDKTQPAKHDHVIFHLGGGTRVLFNDARRFGLVDLATAETLPAHRFFAHLGPEPFDDTFTAKSFAQSLQNKKVAIKLAIMDQRVVVGVGNIYAAEALFDAGIDPTRAAGSLTPAECKKLWAAIRAVLTRAIKAGGSSIRDYVQTDGELGYFQHQWAVYDKQGEKCRKCTCPLQKTGGIKKIMQGGRSTFYCPTKQK
jgi:formamidopyrimidine-DNA glycosylase